MKLERLKETQMDEIMQWAGELDTVLTPDNLNPTDIKSYPSFIEHSEKLKRICKWKADELKVNIQKIKDTLMESIDSEEYVLRYDRSGIPVTRQKYSTKEKRDRALRLQLEDSEEYKQLDNDMRSWDIMYRDWVSHVNRLKKEFDLLEVNYHSNGGDGA